MGTSIGGGELNIDFGHAYLGAFDSDVAATTAQTNAGLVRSGSSGSYV